MKQADIERITRIVLEPLATAYGSYSPELAEMVIEDLSPFDNATLEQAVKSVRRTRMTQPKIAHLVEACREVKGERKPSVGLDNPLAALRKRDDDAVAMATRYGNEFCSSELAKRAKAGGWERELAEYIWDAAQLQARYINRVPNPGFSSMVLTRGRILPREEADRRCREFVRSCQEQARSGEVAVRVPGYLIEEWSDDARRFAEQNAAAEATRHLTAPEPASLPAPPPKTPLEREIDRLLAEKAAA